MFVSLFRPLRVVPNSLDPSLRGLDALSIPQIFANCLSPHASPSLTSFAGALVEGDIKIGDDQDDTTLQNLVGDGADSIVRAWTDSARIMDKLTILDPFLRGKVRDAVRRTLGILPLPAESGDGSGGSISILQRMRDAQRINACRAIEPQSDLETQSEDEDAHARTAKLLFGVSERSQMASPEQIQRCGSPKRRLVEEGSMEEAPIQKVSCAIRSSTSQISEFSSQEKVETGILRAVTDSGLVSLQTPLLSSMGTKDSRLVDADERPSSSFSDASHIASLPFLSLHPSYATSQDGDSPLTDLQNIHLTRMGTERRCIRSHSRSSSRSQSPLIRIFPSSADMHFPNTATKRCKVDKSLDIHCKTDPEEADSPQAPVGLEAIQVGKSTNAARETGSTGECGLGVDRESHRAQRRALRARSRAIEEKLRHALPMHAR
jgi:hypothetical protein